MKNSKLIKSTNEFPVVGVGASAGGLEAFQKLVKAIPLDSGMAFVLVQHLDPNHESLLTDLLQRVTKIPVLEISDDIKVEPNHIYVIPSNKMMVANDGILQLSPRDKTKNKLNLPIDLFFSSLAIIHQTHAIGIVLSGTGGDGTEGLKTIKAYGGLTIAQDEASSGFSGMPKNAVHAGVVDFILPPELMPEKIAALNKSVHKKTAETKTMEDDEPVFKQIISLLHIRKGNDFTYYKRTTISRRILRRMALRKTNEPQEYLKYLKENKSEQDSLYQDLLIAVTSFFRDDAIFDILCDSVFPTILKNKAPKQPLRIWIAGCSTGEEAYSMAICFREFLGNSNEQIQIFATDLSEPAIKKARTGVYTTSELKNVSEERLEKFFVKKQKAYIVKKEIRDLCVFAVHNFLKDPPFGKMDFISCRNVLIYMQPYLQKKAMNTFHYALNPKGILLLGKTETANHVSNLFLSLGKTNKLFSRKDVITRFLHVASQQIESKTNIQNQHSKHEGITTDFQKATDDIILNKYTPAGVVVNEALDIVHFRGNTSLFLEQLPGKPTHNLLKMAKQGLDFELRNIIHKAKKEAISVLKENIKISLKEGFITISIEVIPLSNTAEPYFLILFQDSHSATNQYKIQTKEDVIIPKGKKDDKDNRITQLELELIQIHEDMRRITEDQEAVNEELQSDNEELLSGSEELQSLNEELETSKEELQSTNEALTVVNQEIIGLNDQVIESRDFAEAIVATIREPLIVLDKNLRVQKANFSFYSTFLVNEEATEGKLIYDLGNKQWDIPALRKLLENILPEKTTFKDFEITHTFSQIGERIMLLNAREIKKDNTYEKLILLAIEDVTDQRKTEKEKREIEERYHFIADSMPQKVWTSDKSGNIDYMNKYWMEYTGCTFNELKNWGWEKIMHPDDLKHFVTTWKNSIASGVSFEVQHRILSVSGKFEWHLARGIAKKNANQEVLMWIGTNTQIEEQVKQKEVLEHAVIKRTKELQTANEKLEEKFNELEKMNQELQSFAYVSSHDLQEPLRKIQTFTARLLETEYETLSERGKDYFRRMNSTAQRMQILIEDLLAYSNTKIAEIKLVLLPLTKIVTEVKNDFSESLQDKKTTIDTSNLGEATINPFQFRQVMQNLISNAIKFSKTDEAPKIVIKSRIAIGLEFQKENNDIKLSELSPTKKYCHITFSDNGIGFNLEYKEKIFEVFQRLNPQEYYAGTGIGLAIVKKIIDNHHGIITATSKPNKGAQFDIYIPMISYNL